MNRFARSNCFRAAFVFPDNEKRRGRDGEQSDGFSNFGRKAIFFPARAGAGLVAGVIRN